MAPPDGPRPHIFLSCGEASGDRYGARLVQALRARAPHLRLSALGGPALAEQGVEIIQAAAPIAVMGFAEVVGALPALLAARRHLWRHLASGGVDLCLPVDFPGFNLRLAGRARALGIPVFYVIPPQLWAWGAWRLPRLRASVDQVGTILPFETDFFQSRGVPAVPLGHPLGEDYADFPLAAAEQAREARFGDPRVPLRLGLLPGSRGQELRHLLPILLAAGAALRARLAPRRVTCVVSAAPGVSAADLARQVGESATVTTAPLKRLAAEVDLALVCSGTASLEVALAGVPHAIVYRTSAISHAIARRLVKVRHIGLANLILDERLVPEFIQQEVAPFPLASILGEWCGSPDARGRFSSGARRLRAVLGGTGVWERAADAALALLERRERDREAEGGARP